MKQYTIEYLTTPGNIVDLDNTTDSVIYRCNHWPVTDAWRITNVFRAPLKTWGTIESSNGLCIVLDYPENTNNTCAYIVPLSEFHRIGAVKETLPERWYVKNDGSQLYRDTVLEYIRVQRNVNNRFIGLFDYYGMDENTIIHRDLVDFLSDYIELTLQEFIKLSGYMNTKEENKKIIGYKLRPEIDKQTITEILGTIPSCFDYWFEPNSSSYRKIKELKVLDLWFEPVYKKGVREEIVKIGDVDVKITSEGKIIAGNTEVNIDSIRNLVKNLDGLNGLCRLPWKVTVETIKIGCQEIIPVSKIKEIIHAYENLNK